MKKRILFSVFCLIACMGTKAAESADTTRVYYINGERIDRFDGSQLVGALVESYAITHQNNPATPGAVIEKHDIETKVKVITIDKSKVDTTNNVAGSGKKIQYIDDPVFIIDGKKYSNGEVKNVYPKYVNPKNIKHVTVLKKGGEGALKLDNGGEQHSYIVIETKKAKDGKETE
ncbi:MAG: hypothetical protein IKT30_08995 [Bacteroidaceae bacterium]|nr:hypothetical protein [Bacteroidaceae bacterium]